MELELKHLYYENPEVSTVVENARDHQVVNVVRALGFIVLLVVFFHRIAAYGVDTNGQSTAQMAVAVGPQYDTTHVYVSAGDFDAFVNSFIATFGGTASRRAVANITPVSSSTEMQAVLTPVGNLSIFAFQTPIPFPFGEERTGNLVTDMNRAIQGARAAGAEVIVEPFKDPIGMDAIIQWPGGVKMQLYRHFKPSTNVPLAAVPDSRVYVSKDQADNFVRCFNAFANG
jgi:hypothetical protein